MSITNAERHDLQKGLEELLGEQRANVLMEHLPPVGWADVATKRDLDNLEERLRGGFRLEFGELRHEISELRYEVGTVRTDLQNDIGALRTDVQNDIGTLRTDVQNDIGTLRTDAQNEMGTLRSDLQLQISDLRGALSGQQLRHTVALVGILGTLMAIINAFG